MTKITRSEQKREQAELEAAGVPVGHPGNPETKRTRPRLVKPNPPAAAAEAGMTPTDLVQLAEQVADQTPPAPLSEQLAGNPVADANAASWPKARSKRLGRESLAPRKGRKSAAKKAADLVTEKPEEAAHRVAAEEAAERGVPTAAVLAEQLPGDVRLAKVHSVKASKIAYACGSAKCHGKAIPVGSPLFWWTAGERADHALWRAWRSSRY